MKFIITLNLLLFFITFLAIGQPNPGFETTPVSSNGWALESGSTSWSVPAGAPLRSGNNTLRVVVTTTNERHARHTSGYSVNIPASGTNYVHVIGYALAGTAGDQARVQAISASGTDVLGTYVNFASTNTWQRFTCSGIATNSASYYPGFQVNGNYTSGGDIYRFDDIIIYTSTQAGADLTAPNAATGLSATKNGSDVDLTWTDGADNATNESGIEGSLILRIAGDKTSSLPSPQAQTWYSTNSGIGPATIVNGSDTWTVLTNGSDLGSYVDVGAAGNDYTYVVYMRDKAFNYSTGTAVFYEVTSFENPTSGGVIGNAQSGCFELNPGVISSISAASGYTGTLEYKWQFSTTSDSTGFSDISGSDSATYSPGVLTQTTWFRRLAIVTEIGNWADAAISNVVEMTVNDVPTGVSASVSPNPACVGDTVFLSATGTNTTTWQWTGPGGFSAAVKDTFLPDVMLNQGGNYILVASNGCGNGGEEKIFNQTDLSPWTVQSGDFANAGFWGYLRGNNCCTDDIISAPSTQAFGTWEFEYQFYSTSTTCPTNNQIVRFFLSSNAAGLNDNGYYVYIDVCNSAFQLRKLVSGTPSVIINGTWTPNTAWHKVTIVRNADNSFELFQGSNSKGTGSDSSFSSSSYMGIWTTGVFVSDNHRIKYVKTIRSFSDGPLVIVQPDLNSINSSVNQVMSTGDLLWSGKTGSNSWKTPRNWFELTNDTFYLATTLPTSTRNIYLMSMATASQCVINQEVLVTDTTGNLTNSLIIDTAMTLQLENDAILKVAGNWVNSGTVFPGQSTVIFNGNLALEQKIWSDWVADSTNAFYYLIIENDDIVTIEDNTRIIETLTIESGEFVIPEDRVCYARRVVVRDRLLLKDQGSGTTGGELRVGP